MEKSIVEILDEFENYVEIHQQLEDFGFGKAENITTKNHNYPLMWISPEQHSFSGHIITLRFDVMILTLLKNELTNEKYGLSDTLLIFNDFLSHFYQGNSLYGFKINQNIEINSIIDEFDDKLVGNIATIEIDVFNSLCDIVTPIN